MRLVVSLVDGKVVGVNVDVEEERGYGLCLRRVLL